MFYVIYYILKFLGYIVCELVVLIFFFHHLSWRDWWGDTDINDYYDSLGDY